MSNSRVCSILDIPDEILVKIFLHLNATGRLALGNSCQRFNNLVFGDKELLRNLDFTRKGYRLKESDIWQYFNDKSTYEKILRMNIEHMWVSYPTIQLIGKATNLVELNILSASQFQTVEELACFLKPLVHLKRLSANWPLYLASRDNPNWNQVFEEPMSRLTYLSFRITVDTNDFLPILQFCQQLEELHLSMTMKENCCESSWYPTSVKLSSLKFVKLFADEYVEMLRADIMSIVPDPAEWTAFHPSDPYHEVYLERNVEVCAELSQVKKLPLPLHIAQHYGRSLIDKGWVLVSEHLLREIMRITHEDVPDKFCCLSYSLHSGCQPCPLEFDVAKKLLKDPAYPISYLNLSHVIEKNSDVHLLASAFPNLTTLVLSGISNKNSPEKTKPLSRRLKRKGSLVSEEDSDPRNTDSSFAMLIENTPLLKVLEILPQYPHYSNPEMECWDFDAFNLISHWKNLTVIRLRNIPITDGTFLIDIGKECKKLAEVELCNLSPNRNCSYESELLQMLQHCQSLRKLTILAMWLTHLSEMFGVLSNCSRLEDFNLETRNVGCNFVDVVSSVEKMLRQCQELKKFSTYISPSGTSYKFRLAVESIISELDRPNFQFQSNPENFSGVFSSCPLVPFPRYG